MDQPDINSNCVGSYGCHEPAVAGALTLSLVRWWLGWRPRRWACVWGTEWTRWGSLGLFWLCRLGLRRGCPGRLSASVSLSVSVATPRPPLLSLPCYLSWSLSGPVSRLRPSALPPSPL